MTVITECVIKRQALVNDVVCGGDVAIFIVSPSFSSLSPCAKHCFMSVFGGIITASNLNNNLLLHDF